MSAARHRVKGRFTHVRKCVLETFLLPVPFVTPGRQNPFIPVCASHRPSSHLIRQHETQKASQSADMIDVVKGGYDAVQSEERTLLPHSMLDSTRNMFKDISL